MKLAISEIFYSIQGEGKTIGHPSLFIRLGGCNLICGGHGTQKDKQLHDGATWRCDTIEVWMKSQSKEILDILDPYYEHISKGCNVVITGGEPLMQMDAVVELCKAIQQINITTKIEIETNGTIIPKDELVHLVDQWNCSPKLSNSGMSYEYFFNVKAIKRLNNLNTQFKFVIYSENDFFEADLIYFQYIDKSKIYLMPAGSSKNELETTSKLVAEICKENYLKYSTRLHIDIWNQKTGV